MKKLFVHRKDSLKIQINKEKPIFVDFKSGIPPELKP